MVCRGIVEVIRSKEKAFEPACHLAETNMKLINLVLYSVRSLGDSYYSPEIQEGMNDVLKM